MAGFIVIFTGCTPAARFHLTRRRVRRWPTWMLRRRERQIIARQRPDDEELADLVAIRQALQLRAVRPRRRWHRS